MQAAVSPFLMWLRFAFTTKRACEKQRFRCSRQGLLCCKRCVSMWPGNVGVVAETYVCKDRGAPHFPIVPQFGSFRPLPNFKLIRRRLKLQHRMKNAMASRRTTRIFANKNGLFPTFLGHQGASSFRKHFTRNVLPVVARVLSNVSLPKCAFIFSSKQHIIRTYNSTLRLMVNNHDQVIIK